MSRSPPSIAFMGNLAVDAPGSQTLVRRLLHTPGPGYCQMNYIVMGLS